MGDVYPVTRMIEHGETQAVSYNPVTHMIERGEARVISHKPCDTHDGAWRGTSNLTNSMTRMIERGEARATIVVCTLEF